MILTGISLQNFRSYSQSHFTFHPQLTIIVGPNTAGKSNLLEALLLLSRGKSSRVEKDLQAIQFGKEIGRVKGICHPEPFGHSELVSESQGKPREGSRGDSSTSSQNDILLEVVLTSGMIQGQKVPQKRFLVNDVPKRRVDFASHLITVSFSPEDVDIITDGPSLRRRFLDEVLESVDREYRLAHDTYTKALRQRNALLELARETGRRNSEQLLYWDGLLIKNGNYLTQKRQEVIDIINDAKKEVFDVQVVYDKSLISLERLRQYETAEIGAGVTLVGPHRDDIQIFMPVKKEFRDIKLYGSRGQQRLAILQLKLLQLSYIEQYLGFRPLLLLDDIFSELDTGHIDLVMEMIGKQQTVLTTTHKEFLHGQEKKNASIIELSV